ncbi:MAG: hypothetical protein RR482_02995, partial [Clostridia bacterium]
LYPDASSVSLSVYALPNKPNKSTPDDVAVLASARLRSDSLYEELETTAKNVNGVKFANVDDNTLLTMRRAGLEAACRNATHTLVFAAGDWDDFYKEQCAAIVSPVTFVQLNASAEGENALAELPNKYVCCLGKQPATSEIVTRCLETMGDSLPDSVRKTVAFAEAIAYTLPERPAGVLERKAVLFGAGTQDAATYANARVVLLRDGVKELSMPSKSTIVVLDTYAHYTLHYLAAQDSPTALKKNEEFLVTCDIHPSAKDTENVVSDWQVNAVLRSEAGDETSTLMQYSKSTDQYTGKLTAPKSGRYAFSFQAKSSSTGLSITADGGEITVTNEKPMPNVDSASLNIWLHSPVELPQLSLSLVGLFTDADALTYSLKEITAGVNVDEDKLIADPAVLSDGKQDITLVAKDDEGEVGELTVHIDAQDVSALLKQSSLVLEAPAEGNKNKSVQVNAALTFPEELKPYLLLLSEQKKLDEFVQQFSGWLDIDGQADSGLPIAPVSDGERLTFTSQVTLPSETSEVLVGFTVSNTADDIQVTAEPASVRAINMAPVCIKEQDDLTILLPDVFGEPETSSRQELLLSDYIGNEDGEVLTVTFAYDGAKYRSLTENDNAGEFRLTLPQTDPDSFDSIEWDTAQDAPVVYVVPSRPCNIELRITAKDSDGADMPQTIRVQINAQYAHQETIMRILWILVGAVALALITLVIARCLKPSFKGHQLVVKTENEQYRLDMNTWGKRDADLRQILYCMALPVIGDMADCGKVSFHLLRKGSLVIRRQKDCSVQVLVQDVLRDASKMTLYAEQTATLRFGDGEAELQLTLQ